LWHFFILLSSISTSPPQSSQMFPNVVAMISEILIHNKWVESAITRREHSVINEFIFWFFVYLLNIIIIILMIHKCQIQEVGHHRTELIFLYYDVFFHFVLISSTQLYID
jgi:hypothetical protein